MFPSAPGATCLVAGLGALPRLSRKVIRDLGPDRKGYILRHTRRHRRDEPLFSLDTLDNTLKW
jgi:hypothetical protein